MTRPLHAIALDIGRALGDRVARAEQTNLRALLCMSSLADSCDGKPARAWAVRTISSLSRHHSRNEEIQRYIAELREVLDGR